MKKEQMESVSLSPEATSVKAKENSFYDSAHKIAEGLSQGLSGRTLKELGQMVEDFDFVVSEYNRIRYSRIEKQRKQRAIEVEPRAKKVTGKRWTKQEENFLGQNYGLMKQTLLAKKLGRSAGAVGQKILYMGLTELKRQQKKIPVSVSNEVFERIPVRQA